jgi:hypothetical protein
MSLEERVAHMTTRPLRTAGARFLLPLCSILIVLVSATSAFAAATKPIDVRIVTSSGKTVADFRQYSGKVHVHSTHRAECFGPDNPSTDQNYTVSGTTVLGSLADAASSVHERLLLNNAFADDGFGLGVCGIGSKITPYVAYPATGPYWYSAVNGIATTTGPDLIPLGARDDALWYFASGKESGFPSELLLRAPAKASSGDPFKVTVLRVSPGNGKAKPAEGVQVGGATTNAEGHARLTANASGMLMLVAKGSKNDIPSAVQNVCVDSCAGMPPEQIYGSAHQDNIEGTRNADRIKSKSGDDIVDISRGGADVVVCGGGHDKVVGKSSNDTLRASCERAVGG